MENIVVFGASFHTQYTIDTIEKEGKYRIAGIVDPAIETGGEYYGYPVIGKDEDLPGLIEEYDIRGGFIAIGDNFLRKRVYDGISKIAPDLPFVSTIHPTAYLGKNARIGRGVLVMVGCIVNPNSVVGDFCWLGTGAQLDHDSVMGDFSTLSSGSMTGGKVRIGKYSAITLGVTLIDRISIGENSVVGSGALVMNDLPDNVLAYGVPARVVRSREPGERFLKAD